MVKTSHIVVLLLASIVGLAVHQADRVSPLLEQHAPAVKQAIDRNMPTMRAAVADASTNFRLGLRVVLGCFKLKSLDQQIREAREKGAAIDLDTSGTGSPLVAACGLTGKVRVRSRLTRDVGEPYRTASTYHRCRRAPVTHFH